MGARLSGGERSLPRGCVPARADAGQPSPSPAQHREEAAGADAARGADSSADARSQWGPEWPWVGVFGEGPGEAPLDARVRPGRAHARLPPDPWQDARSDGGDTGVRPAGPHAARNRCKRARLHCSPLSTCLPSPCVMSWTHGSYAYTARVVPVSCSLHSPGGCTELKGRGAPWAPAKALSGWLPRVCWLPCRPTGQEVTSNAASAMHELEAQCHLGGRQALNLTCCVARADHWRAWHDVNRNLDALADTMHPSRCAHACSRCGSSPGPASYAVLTRHAACALGLQMVAFHISERPEVLRACCPCSTRPWPESARMPARRFVAPLGWVPPAPPPAPPPPPLPCASARARFQVLRAPPELRAVVGIGNSEGLHRLLCQLPGVEPWAPCVMVRRRPRTCPSLAYDVPIVGSALIPSQGSLAF